MSLDHLAQLATAQDCFLDLLQHAEPSTPVPWCGDWTVRDMAVHLADVHHWAAAQARSAEPAPLETDGVGLAALYESCAAELRATLAALPADAPCSTLVGTGAVAFWHRRQLHETLVHLWDLHVALLLAHAGRTAGASGGVGVRAPTDAPIPRFELSWATLAAPEVWADTVDEVATVMYPRQVSLGRCAPLPAALRLTATDTDRTWTLAHEPGAPAVEVTGPAAALALLLWRRTLPDDPAVRVTGDAAALGTALGRRLTP